MCLFDIKDILFFLVFGFLGFIVYYMVLNIGEKMVSVGIVSLLVLIIFIFFLFLVIFFF